LRAEAQRRREAEDASRFADLFVGILGHDLRNPLNAVLMTAQLMKRRVSGEDAAFERIRSSAQRMSNMVTQLLDLTRTRIGGGIIMDRKPIDLAAAVSEVVDEIRRAYPGGVIVWTSPQPAWASLDQDRLAQVISNLLSNALEHGDPAKPVTVELSAALGHLVLSVHNQGPPIPTDVMPLIFDPFRRTAARDDRSKGLGLGLFISEQIVRAHGGRIEVGSSVEAGTTFTVRLPELPSEKLAPPDLHLLA
jgi:signal transduction histidine kinase